MCAVRAVSAVYEDVVLGETKQSTRLHELSAHNIYRRHAIPAQHIHKHTHLFYYHPKCAAVDLMWARTLLPVAASNSYIFRNFEWIRLINTTLQPPVPPASLHPCNICSQQSPLNKPHSAANAHMHTHKMYMTRMQEKRMSAISSISYSCYSWYVNRILCLLWLLLLLLLLRQHHLPLGCSLSRNVSNGKLFPRKFNASGNRHMQTQNVSTITYLFILLLWDTKPTSRHTTTTHTLLVSFFPPLPLILPSIRFCAISVSRTGAGTERQCGVFCAIQIVHNKQN